MLDFTELATDGIRFEQLVRELLIRTGLRATWTGKGPDSGRDLIAEEEISGPLSQTQRRWLVDCKHFASSGRSVGVADITDVIDRCQRIDANGLLIVTSTQVSSELARKLEDLKKQGRVETLVWDGVDLEKRLLTHTNYSLAQQFFAHSLLDRWRIFYTERERRWTAHYAGNFLYVESRSGIDPPSLGFLEQIIAQLSHVAVAEGETMRVRAIWHDTPNGCFYTCWADYLVPAQTTPSLSKFDVEAALPENVDGQIIYWHINLQLTLPMSDYFDVDDDRFYEAFREPLYHKVFRTRASRTDEKDPDWWEVNPPPVRNFNDALMWGKVKSLHGFRDGSIMSPPYRR